MELDIMDGAKEGLRGSKIHDLLELNYGDEAPKSRQTVYNYLKHMREQEQGKPESQDDDSVWSLGAMASAPKALCIEWDDIAVILRVRYTLRDEIARAEWGMPDRDLTIAEARWVARLSRISRKMARQQPLALFQAAMTYVNIERLCRFRGTAVDTSLMDCHLNPDSGRPFGVIPPTDKVWEQRIDQRANQERSEQ